MECAIEGCRKVREKRGWCSAHYKRWARHGDPEGGGPPRARERSCDVEGCPEPHRGHGFCTKHLSRWRAGKDPAAPTWRDLTLEERFWRNVDKDGPLPETDPQLGPCWLWAAGKTGAGYGAFSSGDGNVTLAHRWAYVQELGPIDHGLHLDHLCRRRHCVRPSHLDPVPCRVNLMRSPIALPAINASKTRCPVGHEYTPENTRITKAGTRECKQCRRATMRRHAARERAKRPATETLTSAQESELIAWIASGRALALREAAGMTLADVAHVLSAGSRSTIGRWERGNAFPRRDHAVRYYRFLLAFASSARNSGGEVS